MVVGQFREGRDIAALPEPLAFHRTMAYDHRLADEIRARIGARRDLTEKEMFGGIAFIVGGNMAVGVSGDDLMVRVGAEAHDEAVARPGARIFDLSARPMRGWIVVSPIGFETDVALDRWVRQGVEYAASLPPKKKK
jgi:hypothetical protein